LKRTIALLALFLLAFSTQTFAQKTINGAGATFPFPVYQSWAFEYYKVKRLK